MKHALLSLCLCLLATTSVTAQSTWFVDASGTPPGTGTSADPYVSIQYAIEQATTVSGDTLLVRAGIYFEALDLFGKELVLDAVSGPDMTVVDATALGSSVVRLASGEGPRTRIEGFTLRGGESFRGGGVSCSGAALTLVDCRIEDCLACEGGGIFASAAQLVVQRCELRGNRTDFCGGTTNSGAGLFAADSSSVLVEYCAIEGNVAQSDGSGIYCADSGLTLRSVMVSNNGGCRPPFGSGGGLLARNSTLLLQDTQFDDNMTFARGAGLHLTDCAMTLVQSSVSRNSSCDDFWGGGIFATGSQSRLIVRGTLFDSNFSGGGGGAYVGEGTAEFHDCTFQGNSVRGQSFVEEGNGGGILAEGTATVRVAGTLFSANTAAGDATRSGRGGGAFGACVIVRSTFVGNAALDNVGAVELGTGAGAWGARVRDSIFWGNLPMGLDGSSTAEYSDVENGFIGTGNIDEDPLFRDAPEGDYRLVATSPCIDAGDPNSPLDSDGTRADMGAFPFLDCNGNGVLDADDVLAGISGDTNENGVPDECECSSMNFCPATNNSTAGPASLAFDGTLSVSRNDLKLVCSGAPAGKPGIHFYSRTPGQVPFGDGRRCVVGSVYRMPGTLTDAGGVSVLDVDFGHPRQPAGRIEAGSTWYFQFWFRDVAAGGAGFNLSDGLGLTFCE